MVERQIQNWKTVSARMVSRGFTDGKRLEISLPEMIPGEADTELE